MSPKPPKGVKNRPGESAGAALREHLIATAERLMAERPPLQLTTRDIARAAGVADGVLYNHFDDKDDLVIAALLRRYDRIDTRFEKAVPEPGSGTVAGNLKAIARAALDLHAEALPLVGGLVGAPEFLRRVFDRIHGTPARMPAGPSRVAHYFAVEREFGRIAADADPVALTRLLFGGVLTLALVAHLIGGHFWTPPDADIDAMVATLMRGIEPR